MEHIEWIFSGIGTQIITFLVGTITGGFCGYKIGIHKKTNQSQKAGDNSSQIQIGSINYGSNK